VLDSSPEKGAPRTDAVSRRLASEYERPPAIGERSSFMEKRLVTRYAMRSAEAADENQRRVEGVFAELAETKPDNVSYIVLRLADGSFVHVSFHDHGDDEANPIASTAAFAHFQDGHAERREGGVDQQTATLVGAYLTTIA
jgi:predicted SnoaL-like aldol condensation-catalyzing enzyme